MTSKYFHKNQDRKFANYKYLLFELVRRDIRSSYRRSILGPLWVILQPLVTMIVFSIVKNIIRLDSDGMPYAIFSYTALVPWTFFTTAIKSSSRSAISYSSILKKIKVHRMLFPLAGVFISLFNMLMSGLILLGMMLYFQVPITWNLLWLPLLISLTALLALDIGILISSLGVYKRDFLMLGDIIIQFLMYGTPILYAISMVPADWLWLYKLNPMVGIIEGFRNVLAGGISPNWELLLWALPGLILASVVAFPVYNYMSKYFADVL